MGDFPDTRLSLLAGLGSHANQEAWEEFVASYRPVIYRLVRRHGLQDADAHDVVQRVLMSVANSIGNWEPREGIPFRHWLSRVGRNAIFNALRSRPHDQAAGGTSLLERMSGVPENDHQLEESIEVEYRRELYRRAAEQVRRDVDESTWRAFEMTVIQGVDIAEAATELHKSPGVIYAARSRVIRRLREAVKVLESSVQ